MPWTRKQVRLFFSKASPLNAEQQAKFEAEIHADPSLGHKQINALALKPNKKRR
jgi:hypothetical protein